VLRDAAAEGWAGGDDDRQHIAIGDDSMEELWGMRTNTERPHPEP
jgi:hypothetical protein